MPPSSGRPGDVPEPVQGRAPDGPSVSRAGTTTTGTTATGTAPTGTIAAGEPDFPVPPADIVAAARTAPDHWLSVTDRHWLGAGDDEPAPPWAVLGRWRSDSRGRIVTWEPNPDYRPSPAARGWAPPVSDADAALQLAATGYGPEADVAEALAEAAAVAVCVAEDGEPAWTRIPGGTHAVPVFPQTPQAPADRLPAHVMMTLPELLGRLPPGRDVMLLSSSAPAALLVRADELRARWEETAGGPAPGTPARTAADPNTEPGTPSKRGHDE